MLSGGPSGGGTGMIVEESSYHQADIKRHSTPAVPQTGSSIDSPSGWWRHFCYDYHRLHPSTAAVFQRLSAGVEHFRTEDYRRDPFLLKIWLADVYGDEEEVRRLYKYVRSEHIGGDNNVELHLHYAHFELRAGKSEKCATILEAASKIPTLTPADSLRRAIVEFKLLGSFRLDPIIEQQQQPQPHRQILEELILPKQSIKSTISTGQLSQEHLNNSTVTALPPPPPKFIPPPTPSSQEAAPASLVKMTPVPMNGSNLSLPSPMDGSAAKGATILEPMSLLPSSGIKATEEQRAALSHRIRRLGLGPPKRAVVTSVTSPAGGPPPTGIGVNHDSPNDSTVPRTTPRSPLPLVHVSEQETDSPLNSPTKSNPNIAAMAIDHDNYGEHDENLNPINNNMSMTTISPIHQTTATLSKVKKKSQSLQTEAIEEETLHNATNGAAVVSSTTHGTTAKFKAVKINGQSYKILALIGKGGSSRVYKVLANDNTIYAMKKVNLRHLDESTIQGYLNEIDLLESFRSESAPHIIRLIDHEVAPGDQLLMLMEYGEADLSKLLRSKRAASSGGIDANFVRYMWQQMLRAVQTVHAAKIVHCDLKPANFLLVGGTLKLIDFGISKAIMNDTTNIVRENQVGTVNYMSPEALQESNSPVEESRGRIKIGRASDVWSLGCILYEMVYGRPPFAAFSLIQRLQKILDSSYEIDFPPLSPALSDPFLLPVIQGCLLRNSKRRLTLEQLLTHPFLVPQASTPSLGPDTAIVTRQQLEELIGMFAKRIPSLDVPALTDRILSQWQQQQRPS